MKSIPALGLISLLPLLTIFTLVYFGWHQLKNILPIQIGHYRKAVTA